MKPPSSALRRAKPPKWNRSSISHCPARPPNASSCSAATAAGRNRPPPRSAEKPSARCPPCRPAATPARVPPVPHGQQITSNGTPISAGIRVQPRAASPLLPALGQQVEIAEPVAQGIDHHWFRLPPVGGPVHVCQPHAAGGGGAERWVQRQVLLATDDADRGEPEPLTGRGHRADVIGMGAAERAQCSAACMPCRGQVERELAPLVAGKVRADQVIALEVETNSHAGEPVIGELGQRGGQRDSGRDARNRRRGDAGRGDRNAGHGNDGHVDAGHGHGATLSGTAHLSCTGLRLLRYVPARRAALATAGPIRERAWLARERSAAGPGPGAAIFDGYCTSGRK